MNEFNLNNEYKFVRKSTQKNLWDVYKNNLKIERPEYFYKFYQLNIFNIDSILRSYFYLANPSSFNDPFDCNINLFKGLEKETSKLKTVKRNNYARAGVCCLTEKIDSHLMWAHYTNNYNGFVLKFDNISILTKMDEYKASALSPVIYIDNPKSIEQTTPYAHQYLFTTKLKHWDYESEWRIITELTSDNREMLFDNKGVKEIYIGHKVFDNNIGLYKMLLEIKELKYPQSSLTIVYPHPKDLRLEFERVIK